MDEWGLVKGVIWAMCHEWDMVNGHGFVQVWLCGDWWGSDPTRSRRSVIHPAFDSPVGSKWDVGQKVSVAHGPGRERRVGGI